MLESVISEIVWDNQPEGKARIAQAIDEFKAYVLGVLDKPEEVTKSFFAKKEEIKKEDNTDMNAEDVKALLEPITKSLEGLSTKVDALTEKTAVVEKAVDDKTDAVVKKSEEAADAKVTEVAKQATEGDTKVLEALNSFKDEIVKSLEGISERVQTIEQHRGLSGQVPGAQEIKKSEDGDWPIL
jgi:hypothetical protein